MTARATCGVSFLASVVAVAMLVMGCSRSPATLVEVTGKVTFADGVPPAPCRVFFAPVLSAASGSTRPGTADCDSNGNFSALSFNVHRGLQPGRYEARVACWKVPPSASNPVGVSHVPADWTPPVIEVPEGSDGIQLALAIPTIASDRGSPSPRASKAQGPADSSDYYQLLPKEPPTSQ